MLWGLDLKARASEFRTSSFGLRGLASPVAPPVAGPRHTLEGFLAATDMLRVASPARVQPAGFERHVVFQPSQQPHVHVGRLVFGPGRATGSSQRITFARGRRGGGGQKPSPPFHFSSVTSANVGIRPQNFLTFSFNPFERLV